MRYLWLIKKAKRKIHLFLLVEAFRKTFCKKVGNCQICITVTFPQFSNGHLKYQFNIIAKHMKFQHLCYNLKDIAPKKCRLNTSLGKPIDTMFATSDSLKVSAEAVCAGGAEAVVEAPELPGLDSLVSIL